MGPDRLVQGPQIVKKKLNIADFHIEIKKKLFNYKPVNKIRMIVYDIVD